MDNLSEIAYRVRMHCIEMSYKRLTFLGSALSVTDILVALYNSVFDYNHGERDRDYLILDKGHAVPALLGTLVEKGIMDKSVFDKYLVPGHDVYAHPYFKVAGLDCTTGSLGMGFGAGIGIAYDLKMTGSDKKVYLVLGDGTLNEGAVWESALFCGNRKINNLVVIVDRNSIQANCKTEELMPLEPLKDKWESFGWDVITVDGHDLQQLIKAYQQSVNLSKPLVIIANTTRGKGLPSHEGRVDKWIVKIETEEELKQTLDELESNKKLKNSQPHVAEEWSGY